MKKTLLLAVLWLSIPLGHFFAATATCAWQRPSLDSTGAPLSPDVSLTYVVYKAFKPNLSDAKLVGTTTALTLVDPAAPRGVNCYYFVKAKTSAGTGPRSNVAKFFVPKL